MVWLAVSIPVGMVLAANEYDRFILCQTCTHWYGRLFGLKYVFIGDSITAGGRNWGWRLEHHPWGARNLGESGFMVWQVAGELEGAFRYHPKWVFVLAGTNDAFSPEGLNARSLEDYESMLKRIRAQGATPVVTLVPFQRAPTFAREIAGFNAALGAYCRQAQIATVDLNPVLAPQGRLLPQFTSDGVHLSPAAYVIWTERLRAVVASGGESD